MIIDPNSDWLEVATESCGLQNQSNENIRVIVATDAPLIENTGYIIGKNQIEQFEVTVGEKLFVMNPNSTRVNVYIEV
jgi:hypothetical protein